jgi:hypothetical protein
MDVRFKLAMNLEPQFSKMGQKWGGSFMMEANFLRDHLVLVGFRTGIGGAGGQVDQRYVDKSTDPYLRNSVIWYGTVGAVVTLRILPKAVFSPYVRAVGDLWVGIESKDLQYRDTYCFGSTASAPVPPETAGSPPSIHRRWSVSISPSGHDPLLASRSKSAPGTCRS